MVPRVYHKLVDVLRLVLGANVEVLHGLSTSLCHILYIIDGKVHVFKQDILLEFVRLQLLFLASKWNRGVVILSKFFILCRSQYPLARSRVF